MKKILFLCLINTISVSGAFAAQNTPLRSTAPATTMKNVVQCIDEHGQTIYSVSEDKCKVVKTKNLTDKEKAALKDMYATNQKRLEALQEKRSELKGHIDENAALSVRIPLKTELASIETEIERLNKENSHISEKLGLQK